MVTKIFKLSGRGKRLLCIRIKRKSKTHNNFAEWFSENCRQLRWSRERSLHALFLSADGLTRLVVILLIKDNMPPLSSLESKSWTISNTRIIYFISDTQFSTARMTNNINTEAAGERCATQFWGKYVFRDRICGLGLAAQLTAACSRPRSRAHWCSARSWRSPYQNRFLQHQTVSNRKKN